MISRMIRGEIEMRTAEEAPAHPPSSAEKSKEMELTATLDQTDVSCSGQLHMTCKGNCEGMTYFGGSASQMIQLHTLCNNEWKTFEDDACSVLLFR